MDRGCTNEEVFGLVLLHLVFVAPAPIGLLARGIFATKSIILRVVDEMEDSGIILPIKNKVVTYYYINPVQYRWVLDYLLENNYLEVDDLSTIMEIIQKRMEDKIRNREKLKSSLT